MSKRSPQPETAASLDRHARWYLERYTTARGHLRRLLLRRVNKSIFLFGGDRDEAAEWVDAVLDRLERRGTLDDLRFATDRARSLHLRGTSTRQIRAKLAEKGVRPPIMDEALAALDASQGDPDLRAACAYVRKRRLGPFRDDPSAHRERDLARLARAGFPYAVASKVLALHDPAEVEAIERGIDDLFGAPH
ncbi:MAG: RecX family transcriptional regulator [Deltaproteobacteria bacterium]|nr:RecX family transcriptional regulator [Deltaproteobacteria bacterium]